MNPDAPAGIPAPGLKPGFMPRLSPARLDCFVRLLAENERIALTTHLDPDGDAVGSMLALHHVLCQMGKEPVMFCQHPAAEHLRFLPGSDLIRVCGERVLCDTTWPLLVILDCSDPVRLGHCRQLLERAKEIVVIDHHSDPETMSALSLVDDTASAAGEILYEIIRSKGLPLPPEAALALYVAIMTDTGSFRYGNTSARSFDVASDLVREGEIDVRSIGIEIFARETLPRLVLRGMVMGRARLADGLIYSRLTPDMLRASGASAMDAEGAVEDLALCRDAEIAAIFWAQPPDVVRVQLRAVRHQSVLEIATAIGGGGHHKAAGGRMKGVSIEEAERRVLDAVRLQLAQSRGESH